MRNAREDLIDELICELNEEERLICRRIVECLNILGYTPRKESVRGFVLSFKSSEVRQTIARIGIRKGRSRGVFYSIKFYACKNPPERFSNAVRDAVKKTKGQYRCCDCGICGAEEHARGYHCRLPDGTEFLRCGAYVVEIPDLQYEDVDDVNKLLYMQHDYFLTRAK